MNKEEQKIKRLKIKLGALTVFLTLLSVAAVFILSGLSFARLALALSGNYSKTPGNQLSNLEWNNLPADFVARTGGAGSAMQGVLDMGNNRINNLAAPTVNADAANKQYVDTAVSGAGGGGDTFVNWGQENCPTGATELYSGYAFGTHFTEAGGGANPVCIQYGTAGPPAGSNGDELYPLGTGLSAYLPAGISQYKEIKCAVCYRPGGTCFENFGSSVCPAVSGFTAAYSGYLMSSYHLRPTNTNRLCVDNVNFDNTSPANNTAGSYLDGSEIRSDADLGGLYTTNAFVRCSVCCN